MASNISAELEILSSLSGKFSQHQGGRLKVGKRLFAAAAEVAVLTTIRMYLVKESETAPLAIG